MGNSSSSNKLLENSNHAEVMNKLQTLLGGSDTETFVNNQNTQHYINNISKLLQDSEMNSNLYNAVTGDTENLSNNVNTLNHNLFETTSENDQITISENLIPEIKFNTMSGGSINNTMNEISNLLQETEVYNLSGGNVDNTMNKISNLLQDSEINTNNNFNSPIFNKLSNLLQDTEMNTNVVNLRGGALESKNLFSDEDNKSVSELKSKKDKKSVISEEKEEKEEKEEENSPEEESNESEQSGGVELDTELKNILMTLKKENASSKQNSISGGKGRKGKKSKKSKKTKSSRRSVTSSDDETSEMNSDVDTDNEDYLSSTSSIGTSDINVKHYR
jgi:hypothetical protein